MAIFPGSAIPSAAADYDIDNSLRFDDGASSYLSRTQTAGNRKTWTWSCWAKRCALNATLDIFGTPSEGDGLRWYGAANTLNFSLQGSSGGWLITDAEYRDVGAWYHIVVAFDTTESVDSDRVKIWVNGVQLTSFSSSSYPAEDSEFKINNSGDAFYIGRGHGDNYLDGYLAEIYFIDGTAYDADDFGTLNSATNQWIPKDASDLTFGTNGFYQKYGSTEDADVFTDSSSSPHTITPAGNVTNKRTVRKVGASSIYFDGAGDYLSVASASDMEFSSTDPFTLETWVRFDAVAGGTRYFFSGTGMTMSWDNNYTYWQCGIGTGWGSWSNTPSVGTWIHVAIVGDGSDVKIYFDGTERISYAQAGTAGSPTNPLLLGTYNATFFPLDGYMTEIRLSNVARYTTTFTPSTTAFTTDSNTVLLIHSNWGGGLGGDSSGNYNSFTATNLAATDQMVDSPTNNFCTNNSENRANVIHSEGNLKMVGVGHNYDNVPGTILFDVTDSAGWYWEYRSIGNDGGTIVAMADTSAQGGAGNLFNIYDSTYSCAVGTGAVGYNGGGSKVIGNGVDGTTSSYGDSWAAGDIIGVAVKGGAIWFSKNGTWQNSATAAEIAAGTTTNAAATGLTISVCPAFAINGTQSGTANYGSDSSFVATVTAQGNQDANGKGDFYYALPAGLKALSTDNLPDPEIALPGDYFNTVLWAGDDVDGRVFSSVLDFQLDFSWIKNRTTGYHHVWMDSVRGFESDKKLSCDLAAVEGDATELSGTTGYVSAVSSTGFTLSGSNPLQTNKTSEGNYVGWNWKAGGAPTEDNSAGVGATPTADSVKIDGSNLGSALAGTIAATRLSANTTSRFSIVTYTGTGDAGVKTIAHGLSVAPELVIIKCRGAAHAWAVGSDKGMDFTDFLSLDDSAAVVDDDTYWGDAPPTTSVFSVATADQTNASSTYVAYCFASIEGYLKVGSYTGNSSSDGTFVYTGFRPAFLITKDQDASTNWIMHDDKRPGYNVHDKSLRPDGTSAGESNNEVDFLSNGFKWRGDGYPSWDQASNQSGEGYLYIAIAANPFKTSNAR